MKPRFPLLMVLMLVVGASQQSLAQSDRQANPPTVNPDIKSEMGGHTLSGVVKSIDHDKGTLTVESGETTIKLHFPSQAISKLKSGDKITVRMVYALEHPGT